MALLKWDRDEVIWLPTRLARRFHNAAMHWDGTYRDRMWSEEGDFWPNEEDFEDVSASHIARHLA